ncbi:MAG TPA: carbohydrate kinase family protein [Candidatus Saccharimonadales bacterium]|nr:carbohydrate kinase family protein [Candidatus Saccharimonadales bacterium]
MSQFDVLSVGDIVTDAFIKLLDDRAQVHETEQGPVLAMQFGTKIPYDHTEIVHAVGNAPNAAVNFAKLGLKSGMVTNVGSDSAGRDIIHTLEKADVDTRYVHINARKKSNYHYALWYKEERTILIKHEEYDYHWPHIRPKEIPKWIYFSSISKNALEYHDDLADWLEKHPEIKLAFQPGTFQMEAGVERMKRIYAKSELVAVNREEAAYITGGNHGDINDLLDKLHELGPKIAVISDGPKGSYASDGSNRFKMPIYPDPKPPLERTGAGDAFTSTFVAAIIMGNTVDGALQWAPISSMNVVQHVGAQAGLLSEKELASYLRQAPKSYKPQRL